MEMGRRVEAGIWGVVVLCFWSSANGLLSPKGVNFEGKNPCPRMKNVVLMLYG